jgi:CRP/FNR family transcriptional regulator, cyclic AMP receptor protein
MDHVAAFLLEVPIFSALKVEDLAGLPVVTNLVARNDGQIIFREGDAPLAMYVVRSGKVAISVWTEENDEVVLSVLHEGDFFGELSLLDGSRRTATAKALGPVELIEISRDDFFKLLRLKPDVGISIMAVLAQRLRTTNELIQSRAARNVNIEIEKQSTLSERIADQIARWGGSWWFVGGFFVVLGIWIALNAFDTFFKPFDPYPYIFLNFLLGCVAALQAPVIMMSQNRDSQIDRLRADLDYQVNLKAELQIQNLHVKLDELRVSELHELREFQRQQLDILKKWEQAKA